MLKRLLTIVAVALGVAGPAAAQTPLERLNAAVAAMLAQSYQPAYVPAGFDHAFDGDPANPNGVPNTAPAQDYTSGSIPGSPDHPSWPAAFGPDTITIFSGDGAPLRARVAFHAGGPRPGIVVVHGFNTNGKESVIRWAAMLYERGFNVIASDQRDFKDEHDHGEGPTAPGGGWRQTFGWKEAEDVLAAGRYMKGQFSVSSLGVVGWSLGGQDTVLALALDAASGNPVFDAGLQFSGPADQNFQIWTTRQPRPCNPPPGPAPNCTYPATTALVALVVPPYSYTNACNVLRDAGVRYNRTEPAILAEEKGYLKQTAVTVPLVSFYSNDDSLVDPLHAQLMKGYEQGNPLRRTFLVDQGEHAYFFDRYWQQRAILIYFKAVLPGAGLIGDIRTEATLDEKPVPGQPMSSHLLPLTTTQSQADAIVAQVPVVCPATVPTAVTVSSFTASRAGGSVVLRWRTGSETDVAGFNVYAGRARLNRRLIRAVGDARGHAYAVRAPTASRYALDLVKLDGSRSRVSTRAPR